MRLRVALRMLGSLAVVVLVSVVYLKVVFVNATTVALTFLLAVLGIATWWGLGEAVVASVAAGLCFNFFFLPPTGTLVIEDPQNWIAVFVFLSVAVVASQLSASARKRAREAVERQGEMESLYALSRAVMLADPRQDIGGEISHQIARIFGARSVVLYDRTRDAFHRTGSGEAEIADGRLRDAAIQNTESEDGGTRVLPVRLGGEPIGTLAVSGAAVSDTALQSVANIVAIAMERGRSFASASRAEAARQSEELKSTLLDVVAHEFKTPLTSIKASATALLSACEREGSERELLTVIDEEADRLNAMVTEALQVARIEAGDLRMERKPVRIAKVIAAVTARYRGALEQRPWEVRAEEGLPAAMGDRDLMAVVLGHLVDNALKYSPAGSGIEIEARADEDGVTLSVRDHGPGAPAAERERIFDRFYRAARQAEVPGTGMGLAIAREIVMAHEGRIWVEEAPGGGARFSFWIPAAREEA